MRVLALAFLLVPSSSALALRGQQEAGAFFGMDLPVPVTLIPGEAAPSGTLLDRAKGTPLAFGILGYHVKWTGFWKKNVAAGLFFNTDTLEADLWAWDVLIPGSSFALFSRGEVGLAGVNIQYIQDGVNHLDRGFTASYLQVGARAAHTTRRIFTVESELSFRAWLFTPLPFITTHPFSATPTPLLVAEPRIRLKYDDRHGDAGRLGLFTGAAGTLEYQADFRAISRPFGDDGKRNTLTWSSIPRRILGRGFLGARAFRMLWLQANAEAGYGVDEDDISRTRVGGLNPYTVNMPGTAWGEFLAQRFVATHLELGITVLPYLYTGFSAHLALVDDPHRIGDHDQFGLLRGLAAETRIGLFGFGRIHLRAGGTSDVARPGGHGSLGVFGWLEVFFPR